MPHLSTLRLQGLFLNAGPTQEASSTTPPHPLRAISVQQATWLFFRQPDELQEEEQEKLRLLRQASSRIETAYHLVETFLQMVRERTGEYLDDWLAAVEASQLEAFESFVTGIQQDKEAVFAGLTLPYSNGPLEGHVNRLKLIKRSMYGRAKFDLLRLRVLHHPSKALSAKTEGNHKPSAGRVKMSRNREIPSNSQHITDGISGVA